MICARYAGEWRTVTVLSKLRTVLSLSPTHSRLARPFLAFLAALALTLTISAAPAAAVPAPNETVINVDPLITTGLNLAKVKVTPKGAAKGGSAGLYYPVVNATKMNDAFVGTLKHQGGFELKVGSMRFGFSNFVVKTTATTPVSGVIDATPVINGMAMPFTIPMSTVTVTSVTKSSGLIIAKYKLAFNPQIAQMVNDFLKIKVLTPGAAWSTVETRIKRPVVATTPVENR